MRTIAKTFPLLLIVAAACGEPQPPAATKRSALTAEQCNYFEVNGKVQLCHKTSSKTHPYTIIRVSEQACVDAHALHADDYVTSTDPNSTLYDPTCHGGGCLPEGAPADSTVPCCDGLSNEGGVCHSAGVTIFCACGDAHTVDASVCGDFAAMDQECHAACETDFIPVFCGDPNNPSWINPCVDENACARGVCTATGLTSYTCACPDGWTGARCDINIDYCESSPCVGGQCVDMADPGYLCNCYPGWTGTNCDVDVDECYANPCVHGQCTDLINAYQCTCDSGWTGTNCDQAVPTGYDCGSNNPCTPENIAAGLFYFPASSSPSEFIQCSEHGECFTMPCPPGEVWLQGLLQCSGPA